MDRLRSVMRKVDLSETVEEFAAALLAYFGTVSDLVVRAMSSGRRRNARNHKVGGRRRFVFETVLVMFELGTRSDGSD